MQETALTELVSTAFDILSVVLIPLAVYFANRLVKTFESKTKIDVPANIETQIDNWVEQAIHFAVEKSHQKVKAKTEELKGPEKLEVAADFVFDLVQSHGYIDWTKDLIKNKIEAKLGTTRTVAPAPAVP